MSRVTGDSVSVKRGFKYNFKQRSVQLRTQNILACKKLRFKNLQK